MVKKRDAVDEVVVERRTGAEGGYDGANRDIFRQTVGDNFPEGIDAEQRAALDLGAIREEFVEKMSQPVPELAQSVANDAVGEMALQASFGELAVQNAELWQDKAALEAALAKSTGQLGELAIQVQQIGAETADTSEKANALLGLKNQADGLETITIQLSSVQRDKAPKNISFIVFHSEVVSLKAFGGILKAIQNRGSDVKFLTDDGNSLVLCLYECDERDAVAKAREITNDALEQNGSDGTHDVKVGVSTFIAQQVQGAYTPDASVNLNLALGTVHDNIFTHDAGISSTKFAQNPETGEYDDYSISTGMRDLGVLS